MGEASRWPDWFYAADQGGYLITMVFSGCIFILSPFVLSGMVDKYKPCGVPASWLGRLCALMLGLNQVFDLGLHMPHPVHWPHTLANILVFAVAMQLMLQPNELSDTKMVIVSGVLAVVYTDLMQAANIMWLLGGLCDVPDANSFAYWIPPGLGMQGSVLTLLASATYLILHARWQPEKEIL